MCNIQCLICICLKNLILPLAGSESSPNRHLSFGFSLFCLPQVMFLWFMGLLHRNCNHSFYIYHKTAVGGCVFQSQPSQAGLSPRMIPIPLPQASSSTQLQHQHPPLRKINSASPKIKDIAILYCAVAPSIIGEWPYQRSKADNMCATHAAVNYVLL